MAQRWESMRELLHVLFHTLWSLFYITLVLALSVLIFAIIGLQLFSSSYVRTSHTVHTVQLSKAALLCAKVAANFQPEKQLPR